MDANVYKICLASAFPLSALGFGAAVAAVVKLPSERALGKWDV